MMLISYNPCQKLCQLRKTVLSFTPQAMYNQFKRPSAGSVSDHYHVDGYLVPSPWYGFRFEAVSRF